MIIDACRPYRWLKDFPPTNVMSAEKKRSIMTKWQSTIAKLK